MQRLCAPRGGSERHEFVNFTSSSYVALVATFVHLMKAKAQVQGRHVARIVEAVLKRKGLGCNEKNRLLLSLMRRSDKGRGKGNTVGLVMDDEARLSRDLMEAMHCLLCPRRARDGECWTCENCF